MSWWRRLLGRRRATGLERRSLSVDDVAEMFRYNGTYYPLLNTSYGHLNEESIGATLNQVAKSNGIVFALMLARLQVFSQARFQWTRFERGAPADLFGSAGLGVLERPWPGGTTADLLARMEVDVTTAGNAYVRRLRRGGRDRLVLLRPQWMYVILGSEEDADHPAEAADVELLGYAYKPPNGQMVTFLPEEIAHYAPLPDPDAVHLGMSWITPAIRDVSADSLMTDHKRAFMRNAAPQPLDAKVLTPSGWTTMGDLSVGARVIGADGKPHAVTGVYPQGPQDIYRVEFIDGGSTQCTLDHVWTVTNAYDRRRDVTRTMSLAEIVEDGLAYDSRGYKWAVPLPDPVEYDGTDDLPVDPYLLGLLLGDGSFRGNRKGGGEYGSVTLATAAGDADEIAERIAALLPEHTTARRRDRGGWSEFYFGGPGAPKSSGLKEGIRDLGLWGKGSRQKFVPGAYLTAPVKARVALLQGLIDSDGSVDSRQPNLVRFTTNSDQMAAGVVELVRSLGGLSSMKQHGGRDRWTVLVRRLPDWMVPARLLRKASRYQTATMPRCRTIVAVTRVGRKPAQCIRVDVPDSLYLTDDFVVTHNTPNVVIKFDPAVTLSAVKEFKEVFEAEHRGWENAYKTLFLGGGADATVIGKDFAQLEFAVTQGKGESRLAADAGVPPSWVGFSEGLQGSALNAGNFTAARRRFGDGTMQHLWSNAAASLETIVDRPDAGSALWFATKGIPFLHMDAQDAAEVQAKEAATITALVRDGFTADSAIVAVQTSDWGRLVHTGRVSVQLQTPGESDASAPASPGGNGNQEGARGALLGGSTR